MRTQIFNISYTLDTIGYAALRFWEALHSYRVFAFSGEMGAGKTTFIGSLCRSIGVTDTVSSPTFALVNEYRMAEAAGEEIIIYHLDLYRLRDTAEAINAGMEECINEAAAGRAYCFVEWPEKATELLMPPYLWIAIESVAPGERKMTVTAVQ